MRIWPIRIYLYAYKTIMKQTTSDEMLLFTRARARAGDRSIMSAGTYICACIVLAAEESGESGNFLIIRRAIG